MFDSGVISGFSVMHPPINLSNSKMVWYVYVIDASKNVLITVREHIFNTISKNRFVICGFMFPACIKEKEGF